MDDSSKKTALHIKVKEEIIEQIQKGIYPINSQLPTEAEFCQSFQVSRTTIRAALQQLTQEGYIFRRQGQGTFVAEPKIKTSLSQTISTFSEQVTSQGKYPEIKVISLDVIPADEHLSQILSCAINDPVQKLVRIRNVDGTPLQYETSYIPWSLFPGLKREHCQISLYKTMEEQFKVKIRKTEEHLLLVNAGEQISEALNVELESLCFYLETRTYIDHGVVAEYSQTYFHGKRASFTIERIYN